MAAAGPDKPRILVTRKMMPDVEQRISEMLVLGLESAVFVAPPGTVDAS